MQAISTSSKWKILIALIVSWHELKLWWVCLCMCDFLQFILRHFVHIYTNAAHIKYDHKQTTLIANFTESTAVTIVTTTRCTQIHTLKIKLTDNLFRCSHFCNDTNKNKRIIKKCVVSLHMCINVLGVVNLLWNVFSLLICLRPDRRLEDAPPQMCGNAHNWNERKKKCASKCKRNKHLFGVYSFIFVHFGIINDLLRICIHICLSIQTKMKQRQHT